MPNFTTYLKYFGLTLSILIGVILLGSKSVSAQTNNFVGEYFNEKSFTNLALTRVDNKIDFDWGHGSPDPAVDPNKFSIRWTGDFTFSEGNYEFVASADDGVRIFVDGFLVLDGWKNQTTTEYKSTGSLKQGLHNVRVEYFEGIDSADIKVDWSLVGPFTSSNQILAANTDVSSQIGSSTVVSAASLTPTNTQNDCVSLNIEPETGSAPLTVNFTGVGEDLVNGIRSYEFDFGDESNTQPQTINQISQTTTHTYFNPGTFTSTLKVIDQAGNVSGATGLCVRQIIVGEKVEEEPIASVSAESVEELPETGLPFLSLMIIGGSGAFGYYLIRNFRQ